MSSLSSTFERRQPLQRRDSGSSVTSSVAESIIRRNEETRSIQSKNQSSYNELLKNQSSFILNACNDIRFNEQVTHLYQSYFVQDNKNPALILSAKNVGTKQKLLFLFTQKWCWIMIILLVLLCCLPSFFLSILAPKKDTVSFVFRVEWDTMGPSTPNDLKQISLPVRTLIISHTNDGGSCTERSECILRVQNLQAQYRYLADIPFNFLIGDNGLVLEGRGFRHQGEIPHNDTTSTFDNSFGLVVAFIGTFTNNEPAASHVDSFNRFLQRSIDRDVLAGDFRMFLEDQLVLTEPPANGLLRILRTRDEFYELRKIFSRNSWEADPATTFELFTDPSTVISMYQIPPATYPCTDYDSCALSARAYQQDDLASEGYTDIRYNFMIGPFGIFEGRGWDRKAPNLSAAWPDAMLVGLFTDYAYKPGEFLNTTLSYLLTDGIIIGKILNDYTLTCEVQLCRDDL